VSGPLEKKDQLIVEGVQRLRDGQRVKVAMSQDTSL
jgi:hypothetical protein